MVGDVNGHIEEGEWANIECDGGCGRPLDAALVLAFLPAGELRDR